MNFGKNIKILWSNNMPFDFKKEFKEFYMPKANPEIVNVPKVNYIAVHGKGWN